MNMRFFFCVLTSFSFLLTPTVFAGPVRVAAKVTVKAAAAPVKVLVKHHKARVERRAEWRE
jgi:hypothetical protein